MAAAKPANNARVTPVEPKTTGTDNQATVQDSAKEAVPEAAEPLAQTGKNNLLPTIIVLSIVIGCVAIVSASKKIT